MSIEPTSTPLQPVVRFRIHTALIVTTILAVAAAAAGTYYRSVESQHSRNQLVIAWSLFAVIVTASLLGRAREAWRASQGLQVRFIAHERGRSRRGKWTALITTACCVLVGLWIVAGSYRVVLQTQRGAAPTLLGELLRFPVLYNFGIIGAATAALLFSLIRRPIFLCEEGLPLGRDNLVPWNHFVHAEWQTDRPATLKLHKVDGDMYLDVSSSLRSEIEQFIRSKIRFIENLSERPNSDSLRSIPERLPS